MVNRYIVWSGPRDYKLCATLADALDWKEKIENSIIYEPLAMTTAERVCAESPSEDTAARLVIAVRALQHIKGNYSGPTYYIVKDALTEIGV